MKLFYLLCFNSIALLSAAQTEIDTLRSKAVEAIYLNKYTEAIDYFSQVIARNPSDEDAYFDRGLAKEKLNDYTSAIVDFSAQIALDSEHVDAYFLRGIQFQKLNRWQDAIADFEKVNALEFNNADAHLFHAECLLKMNQPSEAEKQFNAIFRVSPNHPLGHLKYGNFLMQNEQLLKGVEHIYRAIQVDSMLTFSGQELVITKKNVQKVKKTIKALPFSTGEKGRLLYYFCPFNQKTYSTLKSSQTDTKPTAFNSYLMAKISLAIGNLKQAQIDNSFAIELDPFTQEYQQFQNELNTLLTTKELKQIHSEFRTNQQLKRKINYI